MKPKRPKVEEPEKKSDTSSHAPLEPECGSSSLSQDFEEDVRAAEELGIVYVDWGLRDAEPPDPDVSSDSDDDPLSSVQLPSEGAGLVGSSGVDRLAMTLQRIADCKMDIAYMDSDSSNSFIDDKEDIRANKDEIRDMLEGHERDDGVILPRECVAAEHISEASIELQRAHKRRLDEEAERLF